MRFAFVAVGVALAGGALAGCESVYSPPAGAPVAQVSVSRARMLESQQAMVLHLGADRSRRDWIGDGILYEYDVRWPVAAERTVFEVELLTYAGYTELYCSTFYSFTPQVGRAYVFTPEGSGKSCRAAVSDVQTGAAPADLRQELAN